MRWFWHVLAMSKDRTPFQHAINNLIQFAEIYYPFTQMFVWFCTIFSDSASSLCKNAQTFADPPNIIKNQFQKAHIEFNPPEHWHEMQNLMVWIDVFAFCFWSLLQPSKCEELGGVFPSPSGAEKMTCPNPYTSKEVKSILATSWCTSGCALVSILPGWVGATSPRNISISCQMFGKNWIFPTPEK